MTMFYKGLTKCKELRKKHVINNPVQKHSGSHTALEMSLKSHEKRALGSIFQVINYPFCCHN